MYTFSSTGVYRIPKSVKCAYAATKAGFGSFFVRYRVRVRGAVVKMMMVPFGVPNLVRHLFLRAPPKKGPATPIGFRAFGFFVVFVFVGGGGGFLSNS